MNVAIAGVGKLGVKIAESLLEGDHSITIIDSNESVLQKISQQLDIMTVVGDARSVDFLKSINIESYDYFLSSTDSDETNIVIASFAKKLGCRHVMARVRDPEYIDQFGFIKEAMDIDFIINPDLAITIEIYKYLAEKYTLNNGIFTSGKIGIIEFPAKNLSKLIGKSMPQVKEVLPTMLVAAISRNGKIIIPHGDDIIQEKDFLFVLGEKEEISKLNSKVGNKKGNHTNIHNVMIIGGGKTGFFLADKLSDFGASVKLVEKDMERCRYLSTNLNNVMVLHGNGADISMLEEENFDEMDAFVTATGYDEENLLLALTAKKRGVEDVISKVSHSSYKGLIEQIGIDMVLNPLDIAASNVVHFIQEDLNIVSSVLLHGQAEIIEFIAHSHMFMINQCLADLDLPDGIIIGAIHRGNQVIIPTGNTKILRGDRVIIISLLSEIPVLEKLLKYKK